MRTKKYLKININIKLYLKPQPRGLLSWPPCRSRRSARRYRREDSPACSCRAARRRARARSDIGAEVHAEGRTAAPPSPWSRPSRSTTEDVDTSLARIPIRCISSAMHSFSELYPVDHDVMSGFQGMCVWLTSGQVTNVQGRRFGSTCPCTHAGKVQRSE